MVFIYSLLLIINILYITSYKYTMQCKNSKLLNTIISCKSIDINDELNDSSNNFNLDTNDESNSYSYKDDSTRYVARVVYDGTKYHGWQEQTNKIRTVQGVLSSALSNRFSNNYPIKATGASRTDKGVHAKGQCIHFDLPNNNIITDFKSFEHSFNRMLPPDLKIYNMTIAPINIIYPFHATISSIGKRYIYRFCTNDYVDPILRYSYSHFYYRFDLELFKLALSKFIGTYDFTAFSNQIEKETKKLLIKKNINLDTIRTIYDIQFIEEGNGYYRIEFHIESALYRMIRNIVGTSLHVAENRMPLNLLEHLLYEGAHRNNNPAQSAPPHGLTLDHVFYNCY